MKVLAQFGVVIVMLCATQFALAEATKALVSADYVRVREKPLKDAASLGFLYKNMVVEIKSQTPQTETIGKDTFYWYEIRGKDVGGWVYGKFLTTNAAKWDVDTYDAPGDMQWLYKRFGESTWYDEQKMNMQSFSMDDYRNLMRAAESGNDRAWVALKLTILQHLKDNPYDANYAYLKNRLYSAEFMKHVLRQNYGQDYFQFVPYSRDLVIEALTQDIGFASGMPDEYWKDKGIVMLVLSDPAGCDLANYAASKIDASSPEVKASLKRCQKKR